MIEVLTAKLNLTDAQVTQVTAIIRAGMQQAVAIHRDDTLSDEEKMTKMEESRLATRAQIRAVLTPAQQAIFDAMPAHPRGPRPAGDAPPPPPPPPPPPT